MNLEEAKLNLGKNVFLDESTIPYTDSDGTYDKESCYTMSEVESYKLILISGLDVVIGYKVGNSTINHIINPKHIKLIDKKGDK